MKISLVSASLLTSLCAFPLSASNLETTELPNSAYTGLYRSITDDSTYIKISQQDGNLFLHDHIGIVAIDIANQMQMRASAIDYSGQFSFLENDQFQSLTTKYDQAITSTVTTYVRVNDAANLASLDEQRFNKNIVNISSHAKCETPFPWSTKAAKNKDIQALLRDAKLGRFGRVNSVLIAEHGQLIAEAYFNGYNQDEKHPIKSATKSIVSLLAGNAIEQKQLDSIDRAVIEFYPDQEYLFHGGADAITIKHLLTMRAGWTWNDWLFPLDDAYNILNRYYNATQPIEFAIDRPLAHPPGSHFSYSQGSADILADILAKVTDKEHLGSDFHQGALGPLCFQNAGWFYRPNSNKIDAGAGMALRPRDMLKVGQLMLNDGQWQEQQIVSPKWIEVSTQSYSEIDGDGYGYYWWRRDFRYRDDQFTAIVASGHGGQNIVIIKELQLVLVTTGYNFDDPNFVDRMVNFYVLPALVKSPY